MKASPVRPGDYLELFAEVDLIGALSACPGGDCGDSHDRRNTPPEGRNTQGGRNK